MDKHKQRHETRSNPMAMPTVVLSVIMIVMLVFMVSINTQLTKITTALDGGIEVGAANARVPTPVAAPTQAPILNLADDDPVKGDADAPVEIIEFSDFECPFCAKFYSETYNKIVENYIDTGKAKLVFRDFPLGFHADAQKAAEAAECARDQDTFWEYHDVLFESRELDVSSLKKHADDLGLDTDEFNTCLDSGKYEAEVKADFADGQAAGVSGTPTFFINGKKLVGAQPYEVFEKEIESALS